MMMMIVIRFIWLSTSAFTHHIFPFLVSATNKKTKSGHIGNVPICGLPQTTSANRSSARCQNNLKCRVKCNKNHICQDCKGSLLKRNGEYSFPSLYNRLSSKFCVSFPFFHISCYLLLEIQLSDFTDWWNVQHSWCLFCRCFFFLSQIFSSKFSLII